ncbi:MAG: pyridine nucleotide-disulfide oxidoreductase [Gammaproteobacteria bacterium]|nr:pyridine nucleotide-disulfide oxidoreductase [Gammaproteobacteria bacterium]
MRWRRGVLVGVVVLSFAAFQWLGLVRYASVEFLQASLAGFSALYAAHPVLTLGGFGLLYISVTALSLPGAAVMSLAAGALFGLGMGVLLVSFAASIGATLAMLSARFVLRDFVQRRYAEKLRTLNAGMARDGPFYLFALRLVPLFPFFAINLAMGLTRLPARTFYWVSQLGMMPGTFVYLNLGTQLGAVTSLEGALTPGLVISLTLLGFFPLLARWLLAGLRARRVAARWPRPAWFDYNLAVIGAGSGGLVAAYIGAATQARVALIERSEMGGDCLNTGCVPSKALLRCARACAELRRAAEFGLRNAQGDCDFAAVMARVAATVRAVAPHDSVARYTALGVECLAGQARLVSPWTIEITGEHAVRQITAAHTIIATGARPTLPNLPGLEAVGYLTAETVWALRELPRRLVVLGGGPVGCELAQAFARCGSQVVLVQRAERLLPGEDPDVSVLLKRRFAREGVAVLTEATALRCEMENGAKSLCVAFEGAELHIAFDQLLVAIGRTPNTADCGLDALGIAFTAGGTIESDEYLATQYPNIHVCGDVAGPFQLTHAAAHQATFAALNALFGRFKRWRVDYRVVPRCTFTAPEVARVGLNETTARAQSVPYEVTRYDLADLDRAIADGSNEGFLKVLTVPGSDRILGVTIMGEHAGETIAEFALAMQHGLGLNKILGTVHLYPSFAEANKHLAGTWKRQQVSIGQRRLLRALTAWLRGAGSLLSVLRSVPALWQERQRAP